MARKKIRNILVQRDLFGLSTHNTGWQMSNRLRPLKPTTIPLNTHTENLVVQDISELTETAPFSLLLSSYPPLVQKLSGKLPLRAMDKQYSTIGIFGQELCLGTIGPTLPNPVVGKLTYHDASKQDYSVDRCFRVIHVNTCSNKHIRSDKQHAGNNRCWP